ncbi:MAG: radical SAM protein [bacterium]
MNVLLIRPHVILKLAQRFHLFLHLEPLDLEIVAGGVVSPHEVSILDLSCEKKPFRVLENRLRIMKPDVVGFGCYSNQVRGVRELAACVRHVCPTAKVIVGGVHATIAPQDLNDPVLFDFVIRGEGSVAIRCLLKALLAGEPIIGEGILATGTAAYAMTAELPPPAIPEFCEVAKPRRDLVDRAKYFSVWAGKPNEKLRTMFPQIASLRTSVGCPRRCSFCVVHFLANGRYIQRTPEDVVDEIAALKEDYIYFVDDEMFINPVRAEAIAKLLIERGIRKEYISWARSDTICAHPDLFRLWKQAGLQIVFVGLEAMDEEALKGFNKGVSVSTNLKAVDLLHEIGIVLHSALIVNPNYSKEDFERLHRTLDRISPAEMSFTVLSPSPGTDYWKETCSTFIAPDPYSFYDCMHTLLPTKLPLKEFYRYFSILYLLGFRKNPWRTNKVKAPWRDIVRLSIGGMKTGFTLHQLWRDYPRSTI